MMRRTSTSIGKFIQTALAQMTAPVSQEMIRGLFKGRDTGPCLCASQKASLQATQFQRQPELYQFTEANVENVESATTVPWLELDVLQSIISRHLNRTWRRTCSIRCNGALSKPWFTMRFMALPVPGPYDNLHIATGNSYIMHV